MTGGVDKMQQVVFTVVIINHAACLSLDSDAALTLHVQLVQDLLVAARLNGAGELEQPVAERALAMIDMGNDAEVPKTLNWDGGDALLKVGLGPVGHCVAGGGGLKGAQPCRRGAR